MELLLRAPRERPRRAQGDIRLRRPPIPTIVAHNRVSAKFIGEFERGGNCSLVTLLYIAEGLKCSLAQLIPETDSTGIVLFSEADMDRMREAVTLLRTTIGPRKRVRRDAKVSEPR